MSTPQMDWLDDQRRKRAVSSDDIVRRMELMDVPPGSYDEETLYDAVDEIKRLREQVRWASDRASEWKLETYQLNTEIERLLAAIDAVLLAITDKGSHPEYHDEVRRRHERDWPTLWRAIAAMREARQ